MAKKKKITRKELLKNNDEFIDFSQRTLRYLIEYKQKIYLTLIIACCVTVFLLGYKYYALSQQTKVCALLSRQMSEYEDVLNKEDAVKAYEAVTKDFVQLIESYSGTDAGKQAQVVYANICYDAGEYITAIKLYEKAMNSYKPDNSLYPLIINGLAYSHEQNNEFEMAVKYFEDLSLIENTSAKVDALYNLGRLYNTIGNFVKSREAYNKAASEFSDSLYTEIIKEKTAG